MQKGVGEKNYISYHNLFYQFSVEMDVLLQQL
jgi:hypothetical protein